MTSTKLHQDTHTTNSTASAPAAEKAGAAKETPSLEPVKEQVQAVREDLAELGRRTKDVASEELAIVRERGGELIDTAKSRVGEWEEATVTTVRERPLRSLAIAAGVGLALGFLIRR